MSLTRSQMDAELQKLYDQIPAIPACDGRCWTSCGPIGMSDREGQRLRQAGYRITPYQQAVQRVETYYCEALTEDKRCAVYEMRPIVCRLWGAVEGLPCVYGCRPEGGYLSDAQGYWLISESRRIGGGEVGQALSVEEISEIMAREHIREELQRIHDRGQQGERLRMDEGIPPAFRRR
jgi:Fe-S-cluster containining protein